MSTASSASGGLPGGAAPSPDLTASVAAMVRAELAAQRQVVSGAQYTAALRAASARATVHVQGIGDVYAGAGVVTAPDDPQHRHARAGLYGRQLAPELETSTDPRVVAGPAARTALRRQAARMLQQEHDRDQDVTRQVQAQQQRALTAAGAFELQHGEDMAGRRRQEMQAEHDAWAASVAHQQSEGARRADRQAQAAIQARTSS